jgi:transcriptional regulator with XRE-family HTH domain
MTGAEIRAWREARWLTQEALASLLSDGEEPPVAPNTVARWERDERSPPPYLRMALRDLARKHRPKRSR